MILKLIVSIAYPLQLLATSLLHCSHNYAVILAYLQMILLGKEQYATSRATVHMSNINNCRLEYREGKVQSILRALCAKHACLPTWEK